LSRSLLLINFVCVCVSFSDDNFNHKKNPRQIILKKKSVCPVVSTKHSVKVLYKDKTQSDSFS
jgi:hypothetical protein